MQAPSGLHAFYNLLKMITQPKNIKFGPAKIALIYVKSIRRGGSLRTSRSCRSWCGSRSSAGLRLPSISMANALFPFNFLEVDMHRGDYSAAPLMSRTSRFPCRGGGGLRLDQLEVFRFCGRTRGQHRSSRQKHRSRYGECQLHHKGPSLFSSVKRSRLRALRRQSINISSYRGMT